ncbi:MAG: ABC transporter substrate-binding protein [Dehalococcoidia bacterium]|nr:ABC transporter substrate-binding protein [Dehalococcoidia bacterium]
MHSLRSSLWYKAAALIIVATLLVPVLAACGDDGDKTTPAEITAPPSTTTPATSNPAITTSDKPVKIGVIIDYSGPAALTGFLVDGVIEFAKWYWNDKQGGILVGNERRPVEFLKYDNKGQVAEAAAAAKKALIDGCTVVTMGGTSNSFGFAIADVTDPAKVLYSTFLNEPDLFTTYSWLVCSFYDLEARAKMTADVVVKKIKAKKVSILCLELETDRKAMDRVKAAIKDLDPTIEIVSEDYVSLGTSDFSSLLTKIKYKNPDVLVTILVEANYQAIAKQILEGGGWGNIQHVGNTEGSSFSGIGKSPGANGWYTPFMYLNGQGSPAQIEFGELWAEKCAVDSGWKKKYSAAGTAPLSNHPVLYNPLLTAIKAIEKAGTDDRAKVAEAAKGLEFDSALGYEKFGPGGQSSIAGFYVHWQDGQPVPVDLSE